MDKRRREMPQGQLKNGKACIHYVRMHSSSISPRSGKRLGAFCRAVSSRCAFITGARSHLVCANDVSLHRGRGVDPDLPVEAMVVRRGETWSASHVTSRKICEVEVIPLEAFECQVGAQRTNAARLGAE
eukprot:6201383-Pleurochrysis_carterae.AAC.2